MVVNVQIQMKNDSWFCETHFMRQDGLKEKLLRIDFMFAARFLFSPNNRNKQTI